MPNNAKAASTPSVFKYVLLQAVLSFIIFAVVMGTVGIHFKDELFILQTQIEQLTNDLHGQPPSSSQSPTACICNSDTEKGQSQGFFDGGSTDDSTDSTTTQNLLSCCSAHQATLETLIAQVYEEKKRQHGDRGPDGNNLSLGSIEKFIDHLLEQNRTQQQSSSGSVGPLLVATHVAGSPDCFASSIQIGSMVIAGPWDSRDGISFSEYIGSDGYHLIVPKSGLYRVYSQAYFIDNREEVHKDAIEYVHHTSLNSTGYSVRSIDLMKSVRIGDDTKNYYSSFHSGLFKLREGDKIFMKVYLPNDVTLDCDQSATYMGMYLVNDNVNM